MPNTHALERRLPEGWQTPYHNDLSQIETDLAELTEDFEEHKATRADASTLGHVVIDNSSIVNTDNKIGVSASWIMGQDGWSCYQVANSLAVVTLNSLRQDGFIGTQEGTISVPGIRGMAVSCIVPLFADKAQDTLAGLGVLKVESDGEQATCHLYPYGLDGAALGADVTYFVSASIALPLKIEEV